MEFDDDKWRAHTFWSTYVKMEEQKFNIPHNFGRDEDDESTGQTLWMQFRRKVSNFFCRTLFRDHYDAEPVILVRRLMYWLRRSYYKVKDDDSIDPKSFLLLYLEKAKAIGMILLLVNLGSLVSLLLYFDDYFITLPSSPGYAAFRDASRAYTIQWLFCNLLVMVCLTPFLFFNRAQDIRIFGLQLVDMWITVGYIVVAVRYLRSLTTICRGFLEGELCYGLVDLAVNQEYAFRFIFFQIVLDGVQNYMFCTLPFTWPWAIFLSTSILCDGILRGTTCAHLIDVNPALQRNFVIGYITILIYFCYPILTIITLNFQRSIRASACHGKDQQQISQETKKIVELLCTDVKVLLRQGSRILDELITQTPSSISLQGASYRIHAASESVHNEVDNLLFLAKLGEGRFEFSRDGRVDIAQTIVSVVKEVRNKIQQMNMDIHVDIVCAENKLVSTDSRCLRVLTFYGLLALYYYREDKLRKLGKSKEQIQSVLKVSIQFEVKNIERKAGTGEESTRMLHMSLAFTEDMVKEIFGEGYDFDRCKNTAEANEDEEEEEKSAAGGAEDTSSSNRRTQDESKKKKYTESFQSISVVCKKLAQACGGDYKVNGHFLSISLPVVVLDTDNVSNKGILGRREMVNGNADVVSMMKDHVCAYVTDANLEGLFVDVLAKMPGGMQMKVHRLLNPVDLKVRSIVIVQSLVACEEVRHSQFTGKIVLFTERLSYLDKQERSHFDFVLPLPPGEDHVEQFVQFVQEYVSQLNDNHLMTGRRRDTAVSDTQSLISSNYYSSQSCWYSCLQHVFVGVSSIISYMWSIVPDLENKVDDYSLWRFMNPAADLYHHSTFIEYHGLLTIFYHSLFVVFEFSSFVYFLGNSVLGFVLLHRRSIYDHCKKNFKFSILWYYHGAVILFLAITSFLLLWINRYSNNYGKSETFDGYLDNQSSVTVIKFNGKQNIIYILISPISIVGAIVSMPYWQACILIFQLYIRCYFILLNDLSSFIEAEFTILLSIQLTGLVVAMSCIVVNLESDLREEFLQLHGLIIDRAYLESCLTLVRHINPSLQCLLEAQQSTLRLILEKGTPGGLIIQESFLQSIHNLQHCLTTGRQLSLDMAIIDEASFFGEYKTDVLDRMHASLLQRVVASVCLRYTAECAASSIHMHIRIAPEVLVIRIDAAVVGAIVSKLCERAIKRIQMSMTQARRRRQHRQQRAMSSHHDSDDKLRSSFDDLLQHHIMIYLEPQLPPMGKVYRFTDVRRLRILVLDSAHLEGEGYLTIDLQHRNQWLDQSQPLKQVHRRKESFLESLVSHLHSTMDATSVKAEAEAADRAAAQGDVRKTTIPQLGVQLERRRYFSLPIADKHVAYFGFVEEEKKWAETYPSEIDRLGSSSCCEEGIVHHRQFKAYQTATAPYLLCSDSDKYRQYLKRSALNRIWRVESLSRFFYPHYLRIMRQHRPVNNSSTAAAAVTTTTSTHRQHRHSSSHNYSAPPTSNHRHSAYPAHQQQQQRYRNHPATPLTQQTAQQNTSNTADAGEGNNVAIFVTQHGQLRRYYKELYAAFTTERKGRCRLHELNPRVIQSFSMPDMSLYTGEEVIMIEYAPSRTRSSSSSSSGGGSASVGSSGSGNAALTWTHALYDAEYDQVRILVHYLRLHGFVGVIVVVGPALQGGAQQIERHRSIGYNNQSSSYYHATASHQQTSPVAPTSSISNISSINESISDSFSLNPALATIPPQVLSRDAAMADAYVSLPLTPEKLGYIVLLKERRMVEVVVSLC